MDYYIAANFEVPDGDHRGVVWSIHATATVPSFETAQTIMEDIVEQEGFRSLSVYVSDDGEDADDSFSF